MRPHRFPDMLIGALLAVAVFALGFVLHRPQTESNQQANAYQTPDSESIEHGFWEKAADDPVAYFTLWLVGFTGVLALSTIGLWVVTWRSGVRQSREMRETLAIGRGTERPHVFMFRTLKDKDDSGVIIKLKGVNFQNVGRTPAFISHFSNKVALFDIPPLPLVELDPIAYPTSQAVIPGEYWPFNGATPANITDEELAEGSDSTASRKLYVYGLMVYADYDGVRYCCWWCRLYANGSFAFDPEGTPKLANIEYNGSGKVLSKERPKGRSLLLKNGLVVEPEIFWYNEKTP